MPMYYVLHKSCSSCLEFSPSKTVYGSLLHIFWACAQMPLTFLEEPSSSSQVELWLFITASPLCLLDFSPWYVTTICHTVYCSWSCLLPASFTGCQSYRTRTVGGCAHCCVPDASNSTWHSLCLTKCLLNKLNEWMTAGTLPTFSASQKHKWVKQRCPLAWELGRQSWVGGGGAALNFWEWLPCVWGGSHSTGPANSVTGVLAQYCQILKLFF